MMQQKVLGAALRNIEAKKRVIRMATSYGKIEVSSHIETYHWGDAVEYLNGSSVFVKFEDFSLKYFYRVKMLKSNGDFQLDRLPHRYLPPDFWDDETTIEEKQVIAATSEVIPDYWVTDEKFAYAPLMLDNGENGGKLLMSYFAGDGDYILVYNVKLSTFIQYAATVI